MIYRRCAHCNRRLPSGSRCSCQERFEIRFKRERFRDYDRNRRDRGRDRFYHSKEWIATRDTVLLLDGNIDVYVYMTEGKIIAADMVHHIVPLKDDWEKRCSIDNLMSLADQTHAQIEKEYSHNKESLIRKLEGMLREYRERTVE